MDHFYVACDLGVESGRVMLGTLARGKLTISEVSTFQNTPLADKRSLRWNIPHLYREVLLALRKLSVYDEPIDSLSCSSWGGDYLLFEPDGSLIQPTYHHRDPRSEAGMNNVLSKVEWETLYDETGLYPGPRSTLFQLGAETPRRLKRARLILPIADGFNYLLSGVPRIELTLAGVTQLFNPRARSWSDPLLEALALPPSFFPAFVMAGTKLGKLRPDINRESGLEEGAQVVASCSHQRASALVGLPGQRGECWAYLHFGSETIMGTELVGPIISDEGRAAQFTNELGFGGSVHFHKPVVGLWVLEECKRFWKEKDRELGDDVLTHLATSATPFESLVDPADPRFLEAGDMPLKIQAFCKETGQPVPRKPGPILRCVLESLALLYRRTLLEIESQTGRQFARLYLLGETANSLLHHFVANALQIPVVRVPPEAAAIGNVAVQALALGHLESLEQAREIVGQSFRFETITPHATVWGAAYERLAELVPS